MWSLWATVAAFAWVGQRGGVRSKNLEQEGSGGVHGMSRGIFPRRQLEGWMQERDIISVLLEISRTKGGQSLSLPAMTMIHPHSSWGG